MAGWTGLIDEMMRKNPRLGACLMNGKPNIDEAAGCLSVTFAKDKKFQVDSISGDCATIEEIDKAMVAWGFPVGPRNWPRRQA